MIRRLQVISKTYTPFDPKTSAGIYISVTPTAQSVAKIMAWAKALGLPLSASEQEELHCTVIYSKTVPSRLRPLDSEARYPAQVIGIEYWDGHDAAGYIVLKMNSPALQNLNKIWIDDGCTSAFNPYQPHVTIKKDVGPMPSNFVERRKRLYRDIGAWLEFSNARHEGLKHK
jgi:hypothetical protein